MKIIENERFGEERALYGTADAIVKNCRFDGEEDGESALKESRNVRVEECFMNLRYPFWHDKDLVIRGGEMTENCRAALWYDENVTVEGCRMNGIKALRECNGVLLKHTVARSPEFGWRCRDIRVEDCELTSEYAFFESRKIDCERMKFTGKYSFQYTENVTIRRSELNTKDAFWHAKNVRVEDSVVNGEYLGWYSEGLTLVRCRIKGTQPFCYCKSLTLIDCILEDCDLAFEYSEVDATVLSHIVSVKNPRKGTIRAKSVGELILTRNSVYPAEARVIAQEDVLR